MVCTDASNRTRDISGTLSNVQTDANGVPQSFTLTDSSSGNKYQYEVKVGNDGTLSYECVSKNGQATIGAPTYTLKDGKLVNENGQNGFGQGIRTTTATQNTPTKPAATPNQSTPSSTNEIKTLPDGTQVSDSYSFITPYEHSDGKHYSKEEAITPWGKYAQNQINNTQTNTPNSIKTKLENSQAFKNAGGSDVKITQNSDGTYTATFKIPGGTRTISGEALQKFIES